MTLVVAAVLGAVVVTFFLAAAAQAVTGFGFALMAVPLLALAIDPVDAVVLVTLTGLALTTMASYRERRHVAPGPALRMTVGGLVGMPLGLVVLTRLDESGLRIVIAVVLVALVVLLWLRVAPPAGPLAQWGSGVVSGGLLASTGMNGPPLVLTLHSMGLSPARFRGTLQRVFWWQDLVAVLAFASLGRVDGALLVLAGAGTLAVPLGWVVGDRVFSRLPAERFRLVVLVSLLVAAGSAAGSALR